MVLSLSLGSVGGEVLSENTLLYIFWGEYYHCFEEEYYCHLLQSVCSLLEKGGFTENLGMFCIV